MDKSENLQPIGEVIAPGAVSKELNRGIKLASVSRNDVMPFFIESHYLKKPPTNTQIYIGIFYNNNLIGVITYGYPTGPSAFASIAKDEQGRSLLGVHDVFELTRLYIKDIPELSSVESQVISAGNRLVKDAFPNLKVIVTYADPSEGHVGTVYQATGAKYLGKGLDTKMLRHKETGDVPRGRKLKRLFGTSNAKQILDAGHPYEKVNVSGKMKYVYIVRNEKILGPAIEKVSKPYVKYEDDQQMFPWNYRKMNVPTLKEILNNGILNENDCWDGNLIGTGTHTGGIVTPGTATFNSKDASQHPNHFYPVGQNKVDMFNCDSATGPNPEDIKKLKKKITPDEIIMGVDVEMKKLFNKDKSRAKAIVVRNLKKDPKYYSSLNMLGLNGEDKQLNESFGENEIECPYCDINKTNRDNVNGVSNRYRHLLKVSAYNKSSGKFIYKGEKCNHEVEQENPYLLQRYGLPVDERVKSLTTVDESFTHSQLTNLGLERTTTRHVKAGDTLVTGTGSKVVDFISRGPSMDRIWFKDGTNRYLHADDEAIVRRGRQVNEIVKPAKEEAVDSKELEMGVKAEMEHTNDKEESKKIALTHLAEDPKYYSKLKGAGLEEMTPSGIIGNKCKRCGKPLEDGVTVCEKCKVGEPNKPLQENVNISETKRILDNMIEDRRNMRIGVDKKVVNAYKETVENKLSTRNKLYDDKLNISERLKKEIL